MTLPHVELGNTASDIGSGASTFVKGLLDQRARQAQLALQTALNEANVSHLNAETNIGIPAQAAQAGASASHLGAETAGIEHDNAPAGLEETNRLRAIPGYEKIDDNYFTGANKKDANAIIEKAMTQAGLFNRTVFGAENKTVVAYDANGNAYIVRPGLPGQAPQSTPMGTGTTGQPLGKPVTDAGFRRAGLGHAAEQSDTDLTSIENSPEAPQVLREVATALQGPSLARLLPMVGGGVEEALAQLRQLGLSPAAQFYVKRLYDHASLIAPDRYGRQFRNPAILHQAWTDFGAGQFGITPAGIQATQANRRNGLQAIAADARAWDASKQPFTPTPPPNFSSTTMPNYDKYLGKQPPTP